MTAWLKITWNLDQNRLYADCRNIGECQEPNRVAHFAKVDPDGRCEKYSVCLHHSAGPVLDSEKVGRWLYTPPHVEKPLPGELCDSFFDDAFSSGLSVQRFYCCWKSIRRGLHSLGQKSVETNGATRASAAVRDQRKYLGIVHFSVQELRQQRVELQGGVALIRIYDTAMKCNTTHAEVAAIAAGPTKKIRKMVAQQMRVRLMTLAKSSGIFKSPYVGPADPDLLALKIEIHDIDCTTLSFERAATAYCG